MNYQNRDEPPRDDRADDDFTPSFMGPYEPADSDFIAAAPEQQAEMMRRWFLARYCNPADELPYNGREGGYFYVNGGPHDPDDVLSERFGDLADEKALSGLVQQLHDEVGHDWSPRSFDDFYDEEYDQRFELDLTTRDQPLDSLKKRLAQAKSLMTLTGDIDAMALAQLLAFSSLITALESFLWETIGYWVEYDEAALRSLVTKLPALKDEQIKLGSIFEQYDGLKARVKGYLQNLVWHRWDKVAQLFKYGLDVTLPSSKVFDAAMMKRHDIVHRSGHDKDGNSIAILAADVDTLSKDIEAFADQVNAQLAARPTPQGGQPDLSL